MEKSLIIAEKPSVASDIAKALGGFKKTNDVFENDDMVIVSAVGHLLTLSVPEKYEISIKLIEPLINKSIAKAKKNNVNGKALTPFLLSEILRETKGKSLEANKALLFNNIDLASKIAKTLANINRNSEVLSLIR